MFIFYISFFFIFCLFFFFNDTATTEIYTLSLHDALPISSVDKQASHFVHIPGLSYSGVKSPTECQQSLFESHFEIAGIQSATSRQNTKRSEERFSRNAETDLVCRLLLEKKKKQKTTNDALLR